MAARDMSKLKAALLALLMLALGLIPAGLVAWGLVTVAVFLIPALYMLVPAPILLVAGAAIWLGMCSLYAIIWLLMRSLLQVCGVKPMKTRRA